MDVLDDILGSLRLTGGVILDGHARGEWCVRTQMQPEDCAALFPESGLIIAYHYVRSGELRATVDGGQTVEAHPGSILLFPRNDPHILYTRPDHDPVDAHAFVKEGVNGGLARFELGAEGDPAEFYCGFMGVAGDHHPLLDSLPAMLVVHQRAAAEDAWLQGNLHFINAARKSPEIIARVAELLFAHAVRAYVAELPSGEGGWLAGLRDPAVARALAIIHSRYAEDLDVETLAREAGVSRSVLGERFVELLGEPPMRYCARWRMRVAANMLRDGKDNSASVAYSVGFNSEAAFNRAFKREFGEPPATWRRRTETLGGGLTSAAAAALPAQVVHSCSCGDGTRLAWSEIGEGPPLLKLPNWFNHLEGDVEGPLWPDWLAPFAAGRRLIRYDARGHGASERSPKAVTAGTFADDLAAVADSAGLDQFDILAIGHGAAVAIDYAARFPGRVRRLVYVGGWDLGWALRGDPGDVQRRQAIIELSGIGWDIDSPHYRQLYTSLYCPDAPHELADWLNEAQRQTAKPDMAVAIQMALGQMDVRDGAASLAIPTLAFHARGDEAVPFPLGEGLSRRIPGARFVPLESRNHILLPGEASFRIFADQACRFLDAAA